jgi:uncharacterized repeat protein (TIGR01451 family)
MATIDISGQNQTATVNGAIITNTTLAISTGTGVFDPFLAIQAAPSEEGFNTDNGLPLDDTHDAFTHSILLNTIPQVTIGDVTYLEFRVDLNESNSGTDYLIMLQQLKIFQEATGNQSEADWNGTDFGTGGPVYTIGDGNDVLLSAKWDAGSGKGDYVFLIPKSNFDFSGVDPYVVVYMQMGSESRKDGDASDSGFDEFGVLSVVNETPPSIEIVKTGPETVAEGGEDVTYHFVITNTSGVGDPVTVDTLTDDVLGDLLAAAVAENGGLPIVLAPGGTFEFDYNPAGDLVLNSGESETNVVTVTGHDDENTPVSDTDDHTIEGTDVLPVIEVVKTGPATVAEGGDTATFTFKITNLSGETDPVTVTSIVDSVYGNLYAAAIAENGGNPIVLESGQSFEFDFTTDINLNVGSQTNVVVVHGHDDENNDTSDDDDHTVTVTDVAPAINLEKVAVPTSIFEGSATDVTYTYEVTNTSPAGAFDPLTLTSFVDDNGTPGNAVDDVNLLFGFDSDPEGGTSYGTHYVSGDTDGDFLVDSDETWTFNYTHAGIVANAGSIINTAVVKGQDDESNVVQDDATATVTVANVAPTIDIQKTVDANGDNVFHENETVQAFGDSVTYKYVLTNTSPAGAQDPLSIDDLVDDRGTLSTADDVTLVDGGVVQGGVTFSGDNGNGLLEAGEAWTFTYTTNVNLAPGATLTNVATVTATDDEGSSATDTDDASVTAVQGPGVRTPGFWSNLGLQFWDGIADNETKVGDNFPIGELTKMTDGQTTVDQDDNDATPEVKGLLIGDYNKNGEIDDGEDVFFISLDDAHKIIDASQKVQQDTRYVLARDEIATWLNYLAGNPIGEATDENSPHTYLDEGIDWLQATNGGTAADTFGDWGGGAPVKASDAKWTTDGAVAGVPDSGATIHAELDTYNNTGSTFFIDENGQKQFVMYASDGG